MKQEDIKKLMQEFGRRGGNATKEKYGVEYFKKMAKQREENRRKLSTGIPIDKTS